MGEMAESQGLTRLPSVSSIFHLWIRKAAVGSEEVAVALNVTLVMVEELHETCRWTVSGLGLSPLETGLSLCSQAHPRGAISNERENRGLGAVAVFSVGPPHMVCFGGSKRHTRSMKTKVHGHCSAGTECFCDLKGYCIFESTLYCHKETEILCVHLLKHIASETVGTAGVLCTFYDVVDKTESNQTKKQLQL